MKNRTFSALTAIFYLLFLAAGTTHLHRVNIEFSPVFENKSASSDYFHSDDFCFLIQHSSTLFCEFSTSVTPQLIPECSFFIPASDSNATDTRLLNFFLRAPPEINSVS